MAAGGNVDIIARALAEQLGAAIGQTFLVENGLMLLPCVLVCRADST